MVWYYKPRLRWQSMSRFLPRPWSSSLPKLQSTWELMRKANSQAPLKTLCGVGPAIWVGSFLGWGGWRNSWDPALSWVRLGLPGLWCSGGRLGEEQQGRGCSAAPPPEHTHQDHRSSQGCSYVLPESRADKRSRMSDTQAPPTVVILHHVSLILHHHKSLQLCLCLFF